MARRPKGAIQRIKKLAGVPVFPDWMGKRLRLLLTRFYYRLAKRDVVILVTGPEGNGKSSLVFHLAQALDPSFGLDRIVYSGREFKALGQALPAGKARVWDEAREGGFSREAMKGENVDVAVHLFEARILRQISFVVWPNIRWIEGIISEHRAQLWILVDELGHAVVHAPRRADYKGAKPSWIQLFKFNFPVFAADWWPEYERRKEARVRGKSIGTEVPDLNQHKIEERIHSLDAVLRKAIANLSVGG